MFNEVSKINPKYLDYVGIVFNLMTKHDLENDVNQAYFQTTEYLLNDQVLNDDKKLLEYNEYHNQLYKARHYGVAEEWTKNKMEYDYPLIVLN